jgi:hypothetical protein
MVRKSSCELGVIRSGVATRCLPPVLAAAPSVALGQGAAEAPQAVREADPAAGDAGSRVAGEAPSGVDEQRLRVLEEKLAEQQRRIEQLEAERAEAAPIDWAVGYVPEASINDQVKALMKVEA